ncbi:MAG: hypothetical protein GY926_18665, partial [bacterium]|nr:hypothetical protein [bacterium]
AVYVLFLNSDGTVKAEQKISDTAGGLTTALDDTDYFGISVSGIGDVDSDGVGDLTVGARLDDDGGADRGAVYVLFLNSDGTVKAEQKISSTDGGLTGSLDDSDLFGTSVTGLGDLDGDGAINLAIGTPSDDDGGTSRGAVYGLDLTVRCSGSGCDGLWDLEGDVKTGLDGDGIADIAVGAYGDDDGGTSRGAVYVLFLNSDGTVKAEQKISDTAGGLTTALDDTDYFGISVSGIGDVD